MVALRCVLLLTSFVIFTAAASAAGQAAAVGEADLKLTRLPSDPALAVYVGLRGTWTHGIFTHEFAEIEAAVAAFQPGEQVSDEFEPWCKRQINDPQPPPGWRFFSVKESRNMRLHVEICDTRQRLGSVLIHDRDTGSVIGRLHADRRGSRISGTILIEPTDRHFTLDVKAKDTGATLCRMGADSPETDDVIICTLIYGFNCNQGLEHACPIVGPDGTWGDPASLADKVSTPSPDCQICIGGYHYMHDAGYAGQKAPRYPLMNKLLLRDAHCGSERVLLDCDPSGAR